MDHAERRAKAELALIGLLAAAAVIGFALPGEPGRTLAILVILAVTIAGALAPKVAFYAVIVIVTLVPAWVDFSVVGLPRSLNVVRWTGTVLVLGCAAEIARRGPGRLRLRTPDLLFGACFALVLGTSALHAGLPGVLAFVSCFTLPLALYLSAKVLDFGRRDLGRLAGAFVVAGVALSVILLYESFISGEPLLHRPGLRYNWNAGSQLIFRPAGTMGGPPEAAAMLGVSTVLAVVLARFSTGSRARILWLVSTGIMVCALVVTFTRSGWMGTIAGLAVVASKELKARRILAVGAAAAVILIAAMGLDSFRSSFVFEHGVMRPATIATRLHLYELSLNSFLTSTGPILGTGLLGANQAAGQAARELSGIGPHNQFVLILLDQGLLGLGLYLAWVATVVVLGARLLRAPAERQTQRCLLLVLPPVISILVVFLFTHTYDGRILAIPALFGSLLVNQPELLSFGPAPVRLRPGYRARPATAAGDIA